MDQDAPLMTQDKSAHRFLFETSFDVDPEIDAEIEQEEEQPPEPTFSKEELDAARQDGYRDGHDAGNAAALDTIEATVAAHLDAIGSLLPRVAEAQAAAHEKLMRDGVCLVTAVAAKVLPALAARHGAEEIEALAADCLSRLVEQPKITVSVAEPADAALAQRLDELVEKSGFEGRFIVHAEDGMGPADCRIEWGDGAAERNLDAVWSEIDAAVSRFLANDDSSPGAGNADDAETITDETVPEGDGEATPPEAAADAAAGAPDAEAAETESAADGGIPYSEPNA